MAAKQTRSKSTEPTNPPDRIISDGSLMKKYARIHDTGSVHASMATVLFRALTLLKSIHPNWPNISENNRVQYASVANTLENRTKNAPTR